MDRHQSFVVSLDNLPIEILQHIATFLKFPSLISWSFVGTSFKKIFENSIHLLEQVPKQKNVPLQELVLMDLFQEGHVTLLQWFHSYLHFTDFSTSKYGMHSLSTISQAELRGNCLYAASAGMYFNY